MPDKPLEFGQPASFSDGILMQMTRLWDSILGKAKPKKELLI